MTCINLTSYGKGEDINLCDAVDAVCEVEGIDVKASEIEKEYDTMAEQNGMKVEDIKKYVQEADIKERLKAQKTIKFLVDNAELN